MNERIDYVFIRHANEAFLLPTEVPTAVPNQPYRIYPQPNQVPDICPGCGRCRQCGK